MAKRRASQAPVGLTSNGILLVNVLSLLDPQQAKRVLANLPARLGNDWFIGVALPDQDRSRVLTRIDDAAAEAAATIAGRNRKTAVSAKKPTSPRTKLAKSAR